MKNKKMKKKGQKVRVGKERVKSSNNVSYIEANTKTPLWQYLVPPVVLSVITALFYAPSMSYNFQFDDIANITKYFHIRHHTLRELFFSGTRWISGWLNTIHYSIGRFNPFSYRVGNLLIHITSGALVFFILLIALRHLKKKSFFSKNAFPIAFLTSLAFLLHPVQTQTVSYVIQGQLEGLAALLILGMTFCFLKLCYAKTIFGRRLATILLFCVAALSCGTKEIAIISPALILLVDWFFVAQGDFQSLKKRFYIHIPLSLMIVTIYIYFLKPSFFTEILGFQKVVKNNIGNIITQDPTAKITPWMFFRSQFKVILHYLWIFIYPLNISVEYDWVLSKSLFSLDCILPLITLLVIAFTVLKILIKTRASMIGFGMLWFFVAIAPRSSIIPSPELLVDYKTYTASFGWLFLLSAGILYAYQYITNKIKFSSILASNNQHAKLVFILLLAIPLGFMTLHRNTIWRSGMEFWHDMIKKAPGKARAYNNYGVELSQNKHDFQGSIPYFKKAISMDKQYPDPWNNLAVAYANVGKIDNAINALKHSLKIYPYHPEGYNNLASFYIQKKEFKEAERLLQIALRLRPHYGKAYFNKGRVHFAREEIEKSWECFKKACTECDFDNVPYGFFTYGKVSTRLGKYDDAIFAYKKALSFDQNLPGLAFGLANAYYMKKDYNNAIAIYRQVIAKNSQDLKTWYNLGEAYYAKQQIPEALNCYKKAAPVKNKLPYWHIKIATCLEKIGRTQEAKKVLAEFISLDNQNNITVVKLQEQAKIALVQMNQRYTA